LLYYKFHDLKKIKNWLLKERKSTFFNRHIVIWSQRHKVGNFDWILSMHLHIKLSCTLLVIYASFQYQSIGVGLIFLFFTFTFFMITFNTVHIWSSYLITISGTKSTQWMNEGEFNNRFYLYWNHLGLSPKKLHHHCLNDFKQVCSCRIWTENLSVGRQAFIVPLDQTTFCTANIIKVSFVILKVSLLCKTTVS